MTSKQAYAVLGLAPDAKPEDIKRAYRLLAFSLHPDLHPDNPSASKDFQRLNEAYVLLSSPKTGTASAGAKAGAAKGRAAPESGNSDQEATDKARADARKAYERAKGRFETNQAGTAKPAGSAGAAGPGAPPSGAGSSGDRRDIDRDEMLQDLLRDPFARRVFEDIYSQIRNDANRSRKPGGPVRRRAPSSSDEPGLVGSMVEGAQAWLRRQIDEEQTVHFAGALTPGSRIRLQVSHGFLSKPQTIELTLPLEFEIGRPIRLKGLGKRIGKWRGDLYLRVLTK